MGEIRLPPLFPLCSSLSLLLALHSSGLVWFLFGLLLIPYSLVTCLFVYIFTCWMGSWTCSWRYWWLKYFSFLFPFPFLLKLILQLFLYPPFYPLYSFHISSLYPLPLSHSPALFFRLGSQGEEKKKVLSSNHLYHTAFVQVPYE